MEKKKYPPSLLPTEETITNLASTANLNKTTGFDYIPYKGIADKRLRTIIMNSLQDILLDAIATEPLFDSQLVLFNKRKVNQPPTVDQLRLIACTCIT